MKQLFHSNKNFNRTGAGFRTRSFLYLMGIHIKYYLQVLNAKKMVMIFLIGLSFFGALAHPVTNKIRIQNVIIYGESNVMDFWLKYDEEATLNLNRIPKHFDLNIDNTEKLFSFQVAAFTAQNNKIKDDFNQMLRSDVNPNIYIKFDEKFCNQIANEDNPQDIEVLLKIGGVAHMVSVEFNSEANSDSGQLFKGKAIIHLADFELKPPKHLFGLVKVKDTIIITFEVHILS